MSSRLLTIFKGRSDLPPSSRKIVEQNEDKVVTQMTVCRVPIKIIPLNKVLNTISLGGFNKFLKEYSYDELFHLFLVIQLRILDEEGEPSTQPIEILLEKNQNIKVSYNIPSAKNGACMNIDLKGRSPSLNQLLQKTKDRMKDSFSKYTAFENNCQDFVWNLLQANGIGTPSLKKFILQDVSHLQDYLYFGKQIKKALNALTDIADQVSIIQEGAGRKWTRHNQQQYFVDLADYMITVPDREIWKTFSSARKQSIIDSNDAAINRYIEDYNLRHLSGSS